MLIVPVMSLGIIPGRNTIDYQEDLNLNINFSIINNENKDMRVLLYVQGNLDKYINLSKYEVDFNISEGIKKLNYNVSFGNNTLLDPGTHSAEIVALELPKENGDGTYVGTTLGVISQLYLNVPYPGKYIDLDLNVFDAEENSTSTFVVPVKNRGNQDIVEVRAIIEIFDSLNNKIDTIETDYWPLLSGERNELSGKWFVEYPSGDYLAKVNLLYDGESKLFEKKFVVGKKVLELENIFSNNFNLGEIVKMEVLVDNKIDSELENVYVTFFVYDENNNVIYDAKSPSENINPLDSKKLTFFWDTEGINIGKYNGKLSIVYGDKTINRNLVLEIAEENLNVFGVGYAINNNLNGGSDLTQILIVIIFILTLINVAWFVFFKRGFKFIKKR